ncbi:hypothetical protein DV737_g1386, partial [Chaetothyriales sp. CBS 132003]
MSSSRPSDTPSTARTIFPKGPSLTVDDFSSKDFIVQDFVESLTESTQQSHRRSYGSGGPLSFDPKPLIRSFEQVQRRLNELSGDLESREAGLSEAVRRAEAQHKTNVDTLGRKLQITIQSFQKLDTSLRSDQGEKEKWGGNLAVETGRKLEDLDVQRKRALDAIQLIQCWDEVSTRGELTQLDTLRRSNKGEDKIRAAHIARQLLRICQRLQPDRSLQERDIDARKVIEGFMETLEKDMLRLFDDFYRRQNFDEMKNCATILQDFNGGASVQAAFVNQHQFFIDRSNLVGDEIGGDQDTWMRLSDPDADLPGVEPGLQSLIDEVKVVIQEESAIIKRAFPNPEQVLGKFVQRVFQQSIQQRLELVLDKALSESTLAYLRSLQAARGYLNVMVDDLKSHGLLDHPETASSSTAQLLDTQLEELFTPYFGGSAYIDKEKHNLAELYKSLVFKFEVFHMRRRKEPKTYLASLRNRGQELLASAREATDAYVKSFDLDRISSTQKRVLLGVAGVKNADAAAAPEIELDEADGRLNVQFAKRMLKWLAEGVRRGLELSGGAETPKDVAALLSMLLAYMGDNYVALALEAASESASAAESSKREPDLSYLGHLRTAISIMHLMQSCINTLLIPLASTSLTTKREMEKRTRTTITRLEDTISAIEQTTVDAVLNWAGRTLANQQRQDFRPRPEQETQAMNMPQTQTCSDVCRFLTAFHAQAQQSFDGANLAALLSEVAVGFRSLLLEHFKKYQVSEVGGVVLARDMSRYVAWKVALDVMTELASVFVLKPEALRERIRGDGGSSTGLRVVAKEHLRPYLQRREDYDGVGMQSKYVYSHILNPYRPIHSRYRSTKLLHSSSWGLSARENSMHSSRCDFSSLHTQHGFGLSSDLDVVVVVVADDDATDTDARVQAALASGSEEMDVDREEGVVVEGAEKREERDNQAMVVMEMAVDQILQQSKVVKLLGKARK